MQAGAKLRKHAPTLVVGGLLLAACAWFKLAYDHAHLVLPEKLAVTSSGSFVASFRMPPARTFHFVLGIPEASVQSPQSDPKPGRLFSGTGRVLEGTRLVSEFEVPAAQQRNWLQRHRLPNAWILNNSPTGPRLVNLLKPGRAYAINIACSKPPPPGSSLWMSFVILQRDRASAKNLVLAP